jgi:hypothetical protein
MRIIQLPLTAMTERGDRDKDTAGTVRAALILAAYGEGKLSAAEKAQAIEIIDKLDALVLGAARSS